MKYIIITKYGQRIIEAEDFEVAVREAYDDHTQYREVQAIIQLDEDIDLIERKEE